jgi:hypothetical protein
MAKKSPLEDPGTAAFAWKRWRRMMLAQAAITAIVVAAALIYFSRSGEPVSIHFYIAVGLGIGLMMLLTGALMGLVFLSNGTGHDDAIGD